MPPKRKRKPAEDYLEEEEEENDFDVNKLEDDKPIPAEIELSKLEKPDIGSSKTHLTVQRLDKGPRPPHYNPPRPREIANELKPTWDCVTLTLNQVPAMPYVDPYLAKSIAEERRNFGKVMERNLGLTTSEESSSRILSAYKYLATERKSELAHRFVNHLHNISNKTFFTEEDKALKIACLDLIRLEWLEKRFKKRPANLKESIEWTCKALKNPDKPPQIPKQLKDILVNLQMEFGADLKALHGSQEETAKLEQRYAKRDEAIQKLLQKFENKKNVYDLIIKEYNRYLKSEKLQHKIRELPAQEDLLYEALENLMEGKKSVGLTEDTALFLKLHFPEWLHSAANSLGGNLAVWNGAAGSYAANTEMAVIENAIAGKRGIGIEVKTYVTPDTREAQWYEYTVVSYDKNGKPTNKITFEIDGTRDWYNEEDFKNTQNKINQFLIATWKERSEIQSIPAFALPEITDVKLVNGKNNLLLQTYLQPGPVFLTKLPENQQPCSNFNDPDFLSGKDEWKRGHERYNGYREKMLKKYPFHDKEIEESLKKDNPDILNKLDIKTIDHFGNNIAHYAALYGSIGTLRAIAAKDPALLTHKNKTGDTPLHLAVQGEKLNVIAGLIENNVIDSATTNNNGDTPLHLAMRDGNIKIITYLLKQKPELLFQANNSGLTPFHIAVQYGHEEPISSFLYSHKNMVQINILKNLFEHSKDGNNLLQLATKYKRHDVLKLIVNILDTNHDILLKYLLTGYESLDQTPLLYSAKYGNSKGVKIIIDKLQGLVELEMLTYTDLIRMISEAKNIAHKFNQQSTEDYLFKALRNLKGQSKNEEIDDLIDQLLNVNEEMDLEKPRDQVNDEIPGLDSEVPNFEESEFFNGGWENWFLDENIIKAIGDGNCAFNALALGLLDLINQNKDSIKDGPLFDFLMYVAKQQSIDTSNGFDNLINYFKELSVRDRQKILGPLLRTLTVDLFRENKEQYLHPLKTAVRSEIRNFIFSQCGMMKHRNGDIFENLSEVIEGSGNLLKLYSTLLDEFKSQLIMNFWNEVDRENIANYSLPEIIHYLTHQGKDNLEIIEGILDQIMKDHKNDIYDWWDKEGSDIYLGKMLEQKTSAGDLELNALANHFGINIYNQEQLISGADKVDAPNIKLSYNGINHWDYYKPENYQSMHEGEDVDFSDFKYLDLFRGEKNKFVDKNIIKAIGDGNCAFNALALALLDYINQNKDSIKNERLLNFLTNVATTYGINIPEELDKLINKFKEMSVHERQKILGPLLRALTVDLFGENKEQYLQPLKSAVRSEFRSFICSQCGMMKRRNGDIFENLSEVIADSENLFNLYDEIIDEFKNKLIERFDIAPERVTDISLSELIPMLIKEGSTNLDIIEDVLDHVLNNHKNNINDWWRDEGTDIFLSKMLEQKTSAGDLELNALADYFGINIYNQKLLISGRNKEGAPDIKLNYNGINHWDYCKPEGFPSMHIENEQAKNDPLNQSNGASPKQGHKPPDEEEEQPLKRRKFEQNNAPLGNNKSTGSNKWTEMDELRKIIEINIPLKDQEEVYKKLWPCQELILQKYTNEQRERLFTNLQDETLRNYYLNDTLTLGEISHRPGRSLYEIVLQRVVSQVDEMDEIFDLPNLEESDSLGVTNQGNESEINSKSENVSMEEDTPNNTPHSPFDNSQ